MKFISGIKLLERHVILHYMLKVGTPVAMPEILHLRGIRVMGRDGAPPKDRDHSANKITTTRQLMLRMCEDGFAAATKERQGAWSLRFVLTPKGRQAAGTCEEFFAYITSLQQREARALETRVVVTSGEVPGDAPARQETRPAQGESPPVVISGPPIPVAPLEVSRPASRTSLNHRQPTSKVVSPVPAVPKVLPPPDVAPAPRPVLPFVRPGTSRMLRCPSCPNEYPLASVKRQMDRNRRFVCDCGTILTNQASDLLDGLPAGGD